MKNLLHEVEQELDRRNLREDEVADIVQNVPALTNRRIVGGYASVIMVDREGHKITKEALMDATKRFMSEVYYRPINVFHCLAPETQILTTRKGGGKEYHNIEDIKVGDRVFTHTGKSQKVLKTIVHDNNGIALRIELSNGEIIRVTDEHPILTKRGWIKAGNLTTEDILLKLDPCKAHHEKVKGKTLEEIYGVEKAKEVLLKMRVKKKGYAVTEKHNSQQRKGHTWQEVYGHNRPDYGGCAGERNSQFGNKGRITGVKNPNWKNGASFEPYTSEFNMELKERIRKSCDNRCFLCGTQTTYRLPVHHIDCNKKNNQETNLIALCRSCHTKAHNEERLAIKNGTDIKSIEKFWYTGKVYNLEVDIDHTYVGKGIIYHNSDVTVGRVLPRWTNPKTGEIVTSHVDDTGWYIVAEIRDDVEIADKVWEEVEKGNIRSFSIAGSSKDKQEGYKDGKFMTEITKLDIYEITLCLVKGTKITVEYGYKNIEDIKIGDLVLTHLGNYQPVTQLFNRHINEKILHIELENGIILKITKNHLILTKNRGWVRAGELTIQDEI